MITQEERVKLFTEILIHGHSYETERKRIKLLLDGAEIDEIIAFVKEYKDWHKRCFPGLKLENSRKAKPGDIVCEVNRKVDLLIFIGSVRDKYDYASTRLVIRVRDQKLLKAHNIDVWIPETHGHQTGSKGGFYVSNGD